MSDYTPTTEEIRRSLCGADPVYNELFDRWLAEHDRVERMIAWDEATERAVHVLTRRYGASYEAVNDLLGDPNPYAAT